MCIAIMNQSRPLQKSYLENSWENNNHGAGILYTDGKKLKVYKSFNKQQFIYKYYDIRSKTDLPILLHFRIATSGRHNKENLHPFLVNRNIGFVHNGVLNGGCKDFSDTWEFNEKLKVLPNLDLNNKFMIELLEAYLDYSKIVFLDEAGHFTILNENLGFWDEHDWFSNDSYLKVNNFRYHGNKKIYNQSSWEGDLLNAGECPFCGCYNNDLIWCNAYNESICTDCIKELA